MRLAIIPARSGSKRIPNKNIKLFSGKPIIAYSIEAALVSGLFDEVVVSTDCQEIADIAKGYGAKVPFFRPDSLADDYTVIADVIRHAVHWYEEQPCTIDLVCCIYATAPMMRVEDLRSGFALVSSGEADMALAVTRFAFPIQRALKLDNEQQLVPFFPEFMPVRSQDLEESFHDAAQFFCGTRDAFMSPEKKIRLKPCIIDRKYVQDIDNQEDWDIAELLYKAHNSNNSE